MPVTSTAHEGSLDPDTGFSEPGVLDRVAASVVVIDRLGIILGCNRIFADTVGSCAEHLHGRHLWEFLNGERLPELRRFIADTEPMGRSEPWNLLVNGSGGDCQLLSWFFEELSNPESGVDSTVVCTGIILTASELPPKRKDDDLIRPLIEYSSDILGVLSPEGTIRYVSPSVEDVLGFKPADIIDTDAFDLVHHEDLPTVQRTIESGLGSPHRPEAVELRIRHGDGSWRAMEARGVAHEEDGGFNLLVTFTDVTRRKQAEAALSESEERFRNAFENTAIGKVMWTPAGRIVRTNRALQNMLGYSPEELSRLSWRRCGHQDDIRALIPNLRRLFSGDIPSAAAVVRTRHKDGPWVSARITFSVVEDGEGAPRHIIGEIEDITEQRMAEEDKRLRTSRLESQRGAIVSIATHDAVVNGHLDQAFPALTSLASAAMAVERTSIWLFDDERAVLSCSDLFIADSDHHSSGLELAADAFPSYFQALEADRVLDADDARSDTRTTELAESYLIPLHITSLLDAPIRVRGRVVGVVCFEHTGAPRIWQSDEITFAGEVADQVAQALANAHRNLAESRLQMSEERFRSVVNAIPMGLFMYRLSDDDSLIFTGANPAADSILGVDCQEFLGKTIEEAFPPLGETEIPERYRRAAADGTPWHTEQIHYDDDRIHGAYEVHAFQTAPRMVTVVFLDITDRKRADEALRQSEERYRSLFERNLAAVFRTTVDGEVLECNPAFYKLLGCSSADEVISRRAEDFYQSPSDRDRLIQAIESHGELRNRELMIKRLDGSDLCVLANMNLSRKGDDEPDVLEGTMVDISERKRAEDRLLLQSTALAAAANAIAITDPDGVIQWVNPAFTILTGYSSSELTGTSLWALKSGGSDHAPVDDITATTSDGLVWQGELVNRRKDGRLYTEEMTVTPVQSEDAEIGHLIAVQQDISERKQMMEQLLQAHKMEAVGRLAGGVAHDFNNLLQAMLGATDLLRQQAAGQEDALSRLSELEEHVRRGSQLTRQLLLFSRHDTERQERLDLNDVVHGTVKLLHRLLRENIDLVFVPADIDLPLLADRGQIEQVVMNLAVNACDAMPRGGRLFLSTGRDAETAWIEVSDSGEGIPDEIRDQLFEPFFTTKDPGKGTGLGLSVVQGIVTKLGGTIDVESRVGEGTNIRIAFPSVEAEEEEKSPAQAPTPEPNQGDGQRILVVEDDPAVRSGLREILGVLGYKVTTVGSREESVYLPPSPAFDLLLTDYVLPDGSGTEIAHELRARWPSMRVVVMSGYAQDVPIGPDSKLDGMEFLQKPFGTDTLADTVRRVLSAGAEQSLS